jgi:hypothetical protein
VLILPLIDLLILMGTGSLAVGFVIKVINVSTRYSPSLLGFNSLDFLVIAAILFAFAMTLVARTWMKLNEPRLAALRRDVLAAEVRMRAAGQGFSDGVPSGAGELSEVPMEKTAGADHR